MRLLLDTNVLIDHYARREPFDRMSRMLVTARLFGDVELWASAKSFTDVFYVGRRFIDGIELQRALTASLDYLDVCAIDTRDIREAASRGWSDFEDCLIAVAAEKVKADFIVTRDQRGFHDSSIPTISPSALSELLAQRGLNFDEVTVP